MTVEDRGMSEEKIAIEGALQATRVIEGLRRELRTLDATAQKLRDAIEILEDIVDLLR